MQPDTHADERWAERYAELMSKYATLSRQYLDLHADHMALLLGDDAAPRPVANLDARALQTAQEARDALRELDAAISTGGPVALNVTASMKRALDAAERTAVTLDAAVKWGEHRHNPAGARPESR